MEDVLALFILVSAGLMMVLSLTSYLWGKFRVMWMKDRVDSFPASFDEDDA